jgi:fatty-acyl-CoA synthase
MFIAELEHPRFGDYDLSSLRTGIMAGSPCPVEVMKKVQAEMHMEEVTICYGMTETSPVSFQTATDYANIVGRIKDMVIRGGENVYPREVEEFLYQHPAVGDVQVVGVPDLRYGEELCAWVRLRAGQQATGEELREWCRGQIAGFKIPRYWRFVEEFPMTVTGKVQKFKMRESSVAELGLESAERTRTA